MLLTTETSTTLATASTTLRDLERRLGSGLQPKRPRAIQSGSGVWLTDTEGERVLDFAAGHGVAALGHSHPRWVEAVSTQAARLGICPDTFPTPRRAELYSRLQRLMPYGLERLFLCNSGTEAVEAALKFARASTGRPGVLAFHGGFHGRTLGALSATARPAYRTPFMPLVPGFSHVRFDDLDAVRAALTPDVGAVILELVQGEGGVRGASPAFVQGLRELCDEHGALLIVDEIQTGYGRTGRFLASDHHDLRPDLLCLGKAIGGGLPMGAVAIGDRVGELQVGSHGSTFGGNPLACAAALAVLDVFEDEQLVTRSRRLGQHAMARLRAAFRGPDTPVRALRGDGLMIGIELRQRVAPIVGRLLERGLNVLPAGPNVLRLLPPLIIDRQDLDRGLDLIIETLDEAHAERDA